MRPMEAQLHGIYEDTEIGRKIQRYLMLTIALCVALFGLILMPGMVLRMQKADGHGKYLKMVQLRPEPEMIERWGWPMFPNDTFTNLRGDYQVRCQADCYENDFFIGEQSHMLYQGMQAVVSGKPLRPAKQSDID